MIKLDVTTKPVRPRYPNEREVVSAMTFVLAGRIRERTRAGQGVNGPLPQSKDGTTYRDTGTLQAAIGHAVSWKATRVKGQIGPMMESEGQWSGVVRAFGARPASEDAAMRVRKRGARQRTAQLRAAASIGGFLRGAAAPEEGVRKIRMSRVRIRTVTDNASLAAILSVRARDKRAANRGEYRVFDVRETEREQLGSVARSMIVVDLV